ncbi:esterase-like activity of phytase family protein [bacterium]|nr:esterase-like activity of phytase family protein [bacterium]
MALLAAMIAGCSSGNSSDNPDPVFTPPLKASVSSPTVLYTQGDGVEVRNGGYGSAIANVPGKKDEIYMMTDRGPNIDNQAGTGKIFPIADFSPAIGHFKISDNGLTKIKDIQFRRPDGTLITGLPNPAGMGSTGEVAEDLSGQALGTDPYGIDSEGLVALADGTFWVSDEYGPHIVHFAADGRELERINPFGSGTGGRKLPAVYATRRANRGMEGLAITNDGQWLVGAMQSTMRNPDKASTQDAGSAITRILFFNISTGATREYAYVQNEGGLSNSEILAIPGRDSEFLVIERDGGYFGDGAAYKNVYLIDITGATDISDPADGPNGKLYGGQTVEQLVDAAGLSANGIVPVSKSLVVNMLDYNNYPHDKLEGIALYDGDTLICGNDDDFSVDDNGNGAMVQKLLPATSKPDNNTIYYVQLSTALY